MPEPGGAKFKMTEGGWFVPLLDTSAVTSESAVIRAICCA